MTANTQEVGCMVVGHMDPESRPQASLYSSVKIQFVTGLP